MTVFGGSHPGFSDFDMAVHDMIAAGDGAAVLATVSGTHDGDFMGIPPTGMKIGAGAAGSGR